MEGLENPWASLLFVLHLFLNYKAYAEKLPELKNYMHQDVHVPTLVTQIKSVQRSTRNLKFHMS